MILTDTTGQTNLPRYFKRAFATAQQIQQGRLDFVLPFEHGDSDRLRLRRWHHASNDNWAQVAQLGFDDRFRRMWNFYLTSCAGAFGSGNCNVTQITIARPL